MKTDLQKFKDLFDGIGIEYYIEAHSYDIQELVINPKNLYHDWKGKVDNAVSIAFDAAGKFMYFEGMRSKQSCV